MKTAIRFLSVSLAISIFMPSFTISQESEGWTSSKEVVERLSSKQPQFNYYEEKVPDYTIPELLISQSGKKINSSGSWLKIRRPEILELFRTNVYGRVPSTEYAKSFRVLKEDKNALKGLATLRQVEISITSGGKTLVYNMNLFTPNNKPGPVPLFLLINHRGSSDSDPLKMAGSEFWPVEELIARGYGTALYLCSGIDPDNYDEFKNGIHGILDNGIRNPDSWGTLAAWAWGASRCMDYLETLKEIDSKKVAVLGHSRSGKTALWAGAGDERFSIVISNESGCGGAALARRRFGETVAKINSSFPHWFCLNFRTFNDNEDAMPVDMHMLLALAAPRAVYVACADEDLWGDPKGSYLALYNSLPAFRLFDKKSVLPGNVPPLNTPVMSGNVGFHIRDGAHNLKLQDWKCFMDFADMIWKRKS